MPPNPRPSEDGITQGRVKSYSHTSGYGFIVTEGIESDIFVHIKACPQDVLHIGEEVTFAYIRNADGRYRATRIIKVEGSE